MIAPDYVEPITGFRVWQWGPVLKSLDHTIWSPGQSLEAECRVLKRHCDNHPSPGDNCSCGIYAARDLKHLIDLGYYLYGICGEVSLWGKVVVHEQGYRAQFAYPKSLIVPASYIPTDPTMMGSSLETLTTYGVPMRIVADGGRAGTLWNPETGYDHEIMNWLLRRPIVIDPVLTVGDRIVVPWKGIGIVELIEEDCVLIKMFGTEIVTVGRQGIKWDEKNYRWESASITHAVKFMARHAGTLLN